MATSPLFFRWFMTGHVPALRAAGWDVRLVSGPGPELAPFAAQVGAPAHPVALEREIRPLSDLRALLELLALLRRLRPELVHASTPKAGLFGMLAAWLLRGPVRVYHCHGLRYETARGPLRLVLAAAERVACGLSTQVLAVSGSLAEALVARGLAPAAKVTVLHLGSVSGVEAAHRFVPASPAARRAARARLGIPPEARVLGFVGRVVRDKGIPELWQAWLALREALPDLHWLLVGPVEDGDPVPPEVLAGLRADPRVHLTGQDEDTPPLFAAMDVVALPSFREGFGLVTAEAGAMGLPVVASRCRSATPSSPSCAARWPGRTRSRATRATCTTACSRPGWATPRRCGGFTWWGCCWPWPRWRWPRSRPGSAPPAPPPAPPAGSRAAPGPAPPRRGAPRAPGP